MSRYESKQPRPRGATEVCTPWQQALDVSRTASGCSDSRPQASSANLSDKIPTDRKTGKCNSPAGSQSGAGREIGRGQGSAVSPTVTKFNSSPEGFPRNMLSFLQALPTPPTPTLLHSPSPSLLSLFFPSLLPFSSSFLPPFFLCCFSPHFISSTEHPFTKNTWLFS